MDAKPRLRQAKINQQFFNPVSQKLPLWDPESFLQKHLAKVSWLFTPWIGTVWLLVILFSALQASLHWGKVTGQIDINALSPYNWLSLLLLYPTYKNSP